MTKYKVIFEEKLTVRREYEIEAENEARLLAIVDGMEEAGFMGKPSDFIPEEALISYTDELDYRSSDDVEYEYFDHYEIEDN